MQTSTSVAVYTVIGASCAAVIFGYAGPLPGFQNNNELFFTPACFQQAGFRHIPLGAALDQVNCILTTAFQAAQASRTCQYVSDTLGTYMLPTAFTAVYESFRPIHRETPNSLLGFAARCATAWLLVSQVASLGLGMSCFFICVTLSSAQGALVAHAKALRSDKPGAALLASALPAPELVWTTLLSAVLGYLLPSRAMYTGLSDGWSFETITIWQPYPVYILAANLLLPPLLRRVLPWTASAGSRAFAIVLLGVMGVVAGVCSHVRLLGATLSGHMSIADILLFRPQPDDYTSTLSYAMHIVLITDLVCITLATATHLIASGGGNGPETRGSILLFAILTALFGPAATYSAMWGYRELCLAFAYERILYGEDHKLEEPKES